MIKKLIQTTLMMLIAIKAYSPISTFTLNADDWNEINSTALLYAIAYTESRFDAMAVNKKENARGLLQIRKGVITDVNTGYRLGYHHDDAFNPISAVNIFYLYTGMYNAETIRDRIMLWNMGPKAMVYRTFTNTYYNKVMKAYHTYRSDLTIRYFRAKHYSYYKLLNL